VTRKRKTPRRKRNHPAIGSAMLIDRRQKPPRRIIEIDGICRVHVPVNLGLGVVICGKSIPCPRH